MMKLLKIAKNDNKNVLVYFTGSDWCAPCKHLKDLFATEEFKSIAESYVPVYIDIPRNKDLLSAKHLTDNKKMVSQFNKKGVFPLLVVLTKKGKIQDELSGYSMNGEIKYHLDFLTKNK